MFRTQPSMIEPSADDRELAAQARRGIAQARCDACGARDTTIIQAVDRELVRLCTDYNTCCQRYRRGATPAVFAQAHRIP